MDKFKLRRYMDANPDAKLRDLVMKLLYDEIVGLHIPPGTKLNVNQLAASLGISRTPVAEAISNLADIGFVISRPGQSGSFVLDENRRVLLKAGKPIELTQVEFQIMELFFRNPGVALVRERILKGVWGENYFGDVKIVDVNIRRLRMKVEDEPSHPAHILTVWGYGYRWEE